MWRERRTGWPLAIAHRAGNDLAVLRAAEAAGVDLVEADVWLHRGRLEVRHEKTLGPVPVLWDRWRLAPGWPLRLSVSDLIRAAGPATVLMFDLKGGARGLPAALIDLAAELAPGRQFVVCSQHWELLVPFRSVAQFQVAPSIGDERRLKRLLQDPPWDRGDAVSVHARLLTPAAVAALRDWAPLVMSWPINDRALLERLAAWGVNGAISDDIELLRWLVRSHADRSHGAARAEAPQPGQAR